MTIWRAPRLKSLDEARGAVGGGHEANQGGTRSSSSINKIYSALMLDTLSFSSVLINNASMT